MRGFVLEMISKMYSLSFLLASCTSNTGVEKASAKVVNMDSIRQVDIIYFPAFDNRAVLHLDRKTGIGIFKVDTTTAFSYGVPKHPLSFSLADMKAKTSTGRLWDEKLLQSLKRDTTRLPPTDGLSLWIFYTDCQHKDSVNLDNEYSPKVDTIILEQLNYIDRKTKDTAMKTYIQQVKGYL